MLTVGILYPHAYGVGIKKENISHIFDPYFSTKEKGSQKGMGLGLSICYSIGRTGNPPYRFRDDNAWFVHLPGRSCTILNPGSRPRDFSVCLL